MFFLTMNDALIAVKKGFLKESWLKIKIRFFTSEIVSCFSTHIMFYKERMKTSTRWGFT